MRAGEEGPPVGDLNDLPQIHDCHPVSDMLDDREVVANEERCQPQFVLEPASRLTICVFTETSRAETASMVRVA
jgi:hypothetical protein